MEPDYSEAATIGMKIIGALLAFLSLRWLVRIFGGKDGMNADEFKKLVALVFFVSVGGWMIWKEGERTDLSHQVYGMGYISIVFGALLVVLHLETALDKIIQILKAMGDLKRGVTSSVTETETNSQTISKTEQQAPMQGQQ